MTVPLVCRAQENGTRVREGETETGQGQGCRSDHPSIHSAGLFSELHDVHSQRSIDKGKSDQDQDGESSSRTTKGDSDTWRRGFLVLTIRVG